MNKKWLTIYPKNCIGCLSCMTITECRLLIDAVRRGGPRFDDEYCATSNCTKCIDICPGNALQKK